MNADSNEEYVKAKWEWFSSFDLTDVENYEGPMNSWLVQVCDKTAGNPHEFYADTEAAAWQAAKDFTVERERQIAEIEEEIEWLVTLPSAYSHELICTRILGHLQSIKQDLQRGLNGAA